jgi:hypothetical protein
MLLIPPLSDPEDIDHQAAALPFDDPPEALTAEARWLRRQLLWSDQQRWVQEQKAKVPTPTETELGALYEALPAQFSPLTVEDLTDDRWFAAACLRAWVERGWIESYDGFTFFKVELPA